MQIIEIHFETIKGTATLIETFAWASKWKIVVGSKYLIISHNYSKAETYTLMEYSNDVDVDKALKHMPIIMWQIDQFLKNTRPKPPKRYR